jgi:hypothetical protein
LAQEAIRASEKYAASGPELPSFIRNWSGTRAVERQRVRIAGDYVEGGGGKLFA